MAKAKSPQRGTRKRVARPASPKSVAVPAHGHSEFELSNEHIEASLRTGEHSGLLEDYFGRRNIALPNGRAMLRPARQGGPKVCLLPDHGSKIGKPGACIY